MIKAAIVGATGYTGSELVRILTNYPNLELCAITSESRVGKRFSEVHPQFRNIVDIPLIAQEDLAATEPDVVFLALPHGVSMDFVKRNVNARYRIIDLSGDFRLENAEVYQQWYQQEHCYPDGFAQAVYGLPELNAERIKSARVVANPGCFPTSAILGLAPLYSTAGKHLGNAIIDAKTGVTGAGVRAKAGTHYPGVNENFKAYGLRNHRHTVEIEMMLSQAAGQNVIVQFTPHLLPLDRGILSSMYLQTDRPWTDAELRSLFLDFYQHAPFVRVVDAAPELKQVRGSNYCDVYPVYDDRTGQIIVLSAIDNLVKGAAGQAVHNMNLQFGLAETTGLTQIPLQP